MVHTYLLYTLLAAASALAAPIAQRDGQDLSSLDEPHPASATPTDIVLPPVSEVFAIMATASSSSPSSSTTADIIHMGPGLVASPTVESTEISHNAPVSNPFEHPELPHGDTPFARKFIFVAVVILSMIATVIAASALSYHCNRRYEQRMKTPPGPTPLQATEKEKARHKFSVTSSDYPASARAFDSESESDSDSDDCSSDADSASYRNSSCERARGPMNPALFFASLASSRRHSRNGSAPVLGVSQADAWREQSRRSRSVSGPRVEWM
ncbi:hypothetical protein B0H14DRAFT_2685464 [Mycena olivaceomarginata]|nr:hypothetical protein B0H14DRAFT_2685464 [Mycena olivaceomarginata]